LPADDAALDELLAEVVAGNNIKSFMYVLTAAAAAERRMDARHLARGAMMFPEHRWLGKVVVRMHGDVPEHLLTAIETTRLDKVCEAAALHLVAAWCEEQRGGILPDKLIPLARAAARKLKPNSQEQSDLHILGFLRALAVRTKDAGLAHRGILLLNMLLYERGLQNFPEIKDASAYNAMTTLWGLGVDLRKDFVRYAEDGSAFAAHFIFSQGKELASAFSRLAIAYPENFREFAERSLTMPSLRGRNPTFTCDAEAIIAAIHLAEKHHAGNLHDNRSRIGALCHLFVARIVDLIEACRLEARQKGHTDSEWWNFPELKGNAKAWWKAEVKQWVDREFEKTKRNPRRNPALWQELNKVTDGGTDSAKRAAFEKYCFNKLEQIAGKPALPASPR
jgi:hypothetical protein